jgi:hypothetical protein
MFHLTAQGRRDIGFKVKLGNTVKIQAFRQLAAEKVTGAIQSLYGFLALIRRGSQVEPYLSMLHVRRN